MKKTGLVLVSALVVMLSGCFGGDTGGKDDESGGSGGGDDPVVDTRFDAPQPWRIGDYWEAQNDNGAITYVVTGEEGDSWVTDASEATTTFFDARFDISNLGPQRKSDLAGSQGDDRVQFFKWPMRAGDRWTTLWDGQEVQVEAAGPEGDDGFHFVARRAADDTLFAAYTYDATLRWFSEAIFYDADEEEDFAVRWNTYGQNYTGNVVRWDLETILDEQNVSLAGASWEEQFVVPETATDVWMSWDVWCDSSTDLYAIMVKPVASDQAQSPRGHQNLRNCPGPSRAFEGSLGAPLAGSGEETWVAGLQAETAQAGTYSITLLIRTMHTVSVEAGVLQSG